MNLQFSVRVQILVDHWFLFELLFDGFFKKSRIILITVFAVFILNKQPNQSGDLAKAIANITHNKSNFINQIDINRATFLSFIGDLKNASIITLNKQEGDGDGDGEGDGDGDGEGKGDGEGDGEEELLTNPDIQNLYKLLVIKNVLGQITWYTLAGVLVSSVSYNYIINMSCDKSLEEITTELNNAEAASLDYAQRNG